MPDVPIIGVNGHKQPNPEDAVDEYVYANYANFARKIGALSNLLVDMPVPSLLKACKRLQTTAALTTPPDQYPGVAASLRFDETVITHALRWQKVLLDQVAAQQGQAT